MNTKVLPVSGRWGGGGGGGGEGGGEEGKWRALCQLPVMRPVFLPVHAGWSVFFSTHTNAILSRSSNSSQLFQGL